MKQKALFVTAVAALLLVFVLGTLAYKRFQAGESVQRVERNQENLVRLHSPTLGKADAPVVIVEFFDPACDTCRDFYPLVKAIMDANPETIRLVLRYAPFHDGSDKVVALLEAARKQGKFWPVLEALLRTQDNWAPNHTAQVALAWKQLDGLGLNLEQMQADISAPQIASVIAQDIKDARALNVTQTPEYFVNGKPLPSFGFAQLKSLVDEALSSARR
jgi:protein-disulfide isomerase